MNFHAVNQLVRYSSTLVLLSYSTYLQPSVTLQEPLRRKTKSSWKIRLAKYICSMAKQCSLAINFWNKKLLSFRFFVRSQFVRSRCAEGCGGLSRSLTRPICPVYLLKDSRLQSALFTFAIRLWEDLTLCPLVADLIRPYYVLLSVSQFLKVINLAFFGSLTPLCLRLSWRPARDPPPAGRCGYSVSVASGLTRDRSCGFYGAKQN